MNVALDKQHGSTKMWIKLKSARGWDKHKNKIVYVPKYLYLGKNFTRTKYIINIRLVKIIKKKRDKFRRL